MIRVRNFAATGDLQGHATFAAAAPGDTVADRSAVLRRLLRLLRRAQHARRSRTASPPTCARPATSARPARPTAGTSPTAQGLPKRYITSVQIDPSDVRTVYVTLGGYSRRWLPPGVLGEDADLGGGNVYKSTDAGETFRDISGNLPDIPANWTLVRNGQLIVATNLGVFVSSDTDGGALRGARLRAADGAGVLARAQAEGERVRDGHAGRRHAGPRRLQVRVQGPGEGVHVRPGAHRARRSSAPGAG